MDFTSQAIHEFKNSIPFTGRNTISLQFDIMFLSVPSSGMLRAKVLNTANKLLEIYFMIITYLLNSYIICSHYNTAEILLKLALNTNQAIKPF